MEAVRRVGWQVCKSSMCFWVLRLSILVVLLLLMLMMIRDVEIGSWAGAWTLSALG